MFGAILELSATGTHIDAAGLSPLHGETDKPCLVSSSFHSERLRWPPDFARVSSLRFFDALGLGQAQSHTLTVRAKDRPRFRNSNDPPTEPPTTPLIKTGELGYRLEDDQNGVRDVAANLRVAISGREKDSRNIAESRSVIGDVRSALAALSTKTADADVPEQEEIQTVVKSRAPGEIVDGETKSGLMGSKLSEKFRANCGTGIEKADISDIQGKLDVLLGLFRKTLHPPLHPRLHLMPYRYDRCSGPLVTMDLLSTEDSVKLSEPESPSDVHDAGPGEWTDNT
ncbi:hypothetical protein EDB84DRAFT_1583124 [Lactarius hengduanensis]|nr:hypothetical protein EDB84DRAFT_1583124 [Lactarius hengduanensis]